MRIFLLADVKNVGRRHEVKDLSDGFARNFIVARKLGIPVNDSTKLQIEKLSKEADKSKSARDAKHSELREKLKGVSVKISAKANDEGHLFAAIKERDIAKALATSGGVAIDENMIEIETPIKELGSHSVKIKIGDGFASLEVVVEKI